MEVLGIDEEDLIEQYMDMLESTCKSKKSREDMRFHVTYNMNLINVNDHKFVLPAIGSDKPLTIRETAKFLVDNVGKTDKIKITSL